MEKKPFTQSLKCTLWAAAKDVYSHGDHYLLKAMASLLFAVSHDVIFHETAWYDKWVNMIFLGFLGYKAGGELALTILGKTNKQ